VAALIPPSMVPTLPQKLARVAGAALDPSGRLTLDLTIRGTVSHPIMLWDSERTLSRLLERGPESLLAIVQGLGGSLQDSIQTGRSTIDALAGALFDAQKRKLGNEVAQEKESQATSTLKQLEDLFTRRPSAPPPPVVDSTQAARDTTHAAPPPPPAPLPTSEPPREPVLTPGPPDSTTPGSAGAPAASTGASPGAPLTAPATKAPATAPPPAPLKGLLDLLKKKPPAPPPDTTAR